MALGTAGDVLHFNLIMSHLCLQHSHIIQICIAHYSSSEVGCGVLLEVSMLRIASAAFVLFTVLISTSFIPSSSAEAGHYGVRYGGLRGGAVYGPPCTALVATVIGLATMVAPIGSMIPRLITSMAVTMVILTTAFIVTFTLGAPTTDIGTNPCA